MGTNNYTGQLKGPFTANRELFDLILEQSVDSIDYISHLGVQATPGTVITINGVDIEISRTKIYEASSDEMKVTSIMFKNGADEDTIIDYHII